MMEPQYVCGAATSVGTPRRKLSHDTRPTADAAGIDTAEKMRKSALRSSVSLDKKRPHKCSAPRPRADSGPHSALNDIRCYNALPEGKHLGIVHVNGDVDPV